MTSQFLQLPDQLFVDLLRSHWNLYRPLERRGIHMSVVGPHGDEVLGFYVDYRDAGLQSRPLGQKDVLALVVAPRDVDVGSCCWPRPLTSSPVVGVIEKIQDIINVADDLTGHDRISFVQYLEAAKTAPATGPRPISPSSSCSPWHPRLLAEGRALSASFAPVLQELEQKLEAYRSRLAEVDCEVGVLGLSSHAELAACTRFAQQKQSDRKLALRQRSNTRRGSLRRSIDCGMQLADATHSALRRFDPYSNAYSPLKCVRELVGIHDDIQPTALSLRGKARWRQHCWSDSEIVEKLPVRSVVPVEAVPDATEIWLGDRDAGRWEGVHAFIRSLLLHVRFLDIRPFQSENGRMSRVLLAVDLQAAGWPLLPWEAAIERKYDGYLVALRDALRLKSHEGLLRFMIEAADDAITIGNKLIGVIAPERIRVALALRHPECLGPALGRDAATNYAEDVLKRMLIETVPQVDFDRFLLNDLSHLGVFDRISSPVGTVFSIPAVRKLLTGLFD